MFATLLLAASLGQQPPAGLDPLLKTLRTQPMSRGYGLGRPGLEPHPFHVALADLARRNGEDPKGWTDHRHGKATGVSGNDALTVAALGLNLISVPGTADQCLLLFDPAGKLLDRVRVSMNSRYGHLVTETGRTDAADAAQLVVRFVPDSDYTWHNWHTVTRDGKAYTFRCKERDEPVDWMGRGLLRLAVIAGKFQVLFPELKTPDAPPK